MDFIIGCIIWYFIYKAWTQHVAGRTAEAEILAKRKGAGEWLTNEEYRILRKYL